MNTQAFIEKIAPAAVQCMGESGILASLTIAQAALESGWGNSAPGNMLFGIKASSSWKGKTQLLTTHEVIKGVSTKVQAKFRAYDSWLDSIRDHAQLLTTNPRYSKVVGERDYEKACKAIQAAGYATDPDYAEKLIGLIEKYRLDKFDRVGDGLQYVRCVANYDSATDAIFKDNLVYIPASILKKIGVRVDWDNDNKIAYVFK